MFAFLTGGGTVVLVLILFCAALSVVIIVDRMKFFLTIKKKEADLFGSLNNLVQHRDYDGAMLACEEAGSPVALLLRKILQFRNYPDTDIKELVENETKRLMPLVEKWIALLASIAHGATLLGLLGTVIASIKIFGFFGDDVAILQNLPSLGMALSHALITTAAGLFVSIPTMIFHNYFVACIDANLTLMETSASDLIIRLSGRDKLL